MAVPSEVLRTVASEEVKVPEHRDFPGSHLSSPPCMQCSHTEHQYTVVLALQGYMSPEAAWE